MTAMVWSPLKDVCPLAAVTGVKMPVMEQEEEAWRNLTPLDRRIVNRDLSKIINWEDLVKDRTQWRSAIHQLHLPASSTNPV